MGYRVADFEREIEELKLGGSPEAVVAAEQRATMADLHTKKEKLLAELTEAPPRLELSDKELNDTQADLCDAQRQLKEQ
ncbi:hypothetical protein GW17_00033520 [Ensete ventricosum]|nr:hypothetical protein GW17_00033520 [Ensete ventricosum]